MNFWSSKSNKHVSLVLHLTSSSVGAALVSINKGSVPEMLSTIRIPFFFEEVPTQADFEIKMFIALREALETLSKLGKKCDSVNVFFSAPWVSTYLDSFAIKEEKGVLLDDKTLGKLMKTKEEEIKQTMLAKSNVEVFEMLVTGVRLNGYEARLPVTKPATNAEIAVLMSAAEKRLRLAIEDEILRVFGLKQGIKMGSYASVFSRMLLSSFQNIHTALLVSIETEMTDIVLIRHSIPTVVLAVPFGSAFIARRVAKRLKISLPVAYSYLSLYAAKEFEDKYHDELDEVVSEAEEDWKRLWQEAEEKLAGGVSLPSTVFLVDDTTPGEVHRMLLQKVLPHAQVTVVGEHNTFTTELVKMKAGEKGDEALHLCASYIAQDYI